MSGPEVVRELLRNMPELNDCLREHRAGTEPEAVTWSCTAVASAGER